ncbi:hypothetical protein [Shimia thalassica]|uniref:hypothetical protein n=1 Tax=Shimia thalassica TaxID=1715693 RepID=UPI001C082E64|nr:hypothetical protein [Shimia thalassica]MBU2942798.1 hypothetical protein [Shimia thalassica]MDO6480125.1 hypothetical protein [Shimia thalassica]MDO6502434.1 hypothetical protein [Shimia thalassica]
MATKAELEAELAELKKQLAQRPEKQAEPEERVPSTQTEDAPPAEAPIDWDKEISEVMTHLEEFPHKQPLLLAFGAFAIGYMIGRSK